MYASDKKAYIFIIIFLSFIICFAFYNIDIMTTLSNKIKSIFLLLVLLGASIALGYSLFKLINNKIFLFQTIFERSGDAIAIVGQDGYYQWQNSANLAFCGFSNSDLYQIKATLLAGSNTLDLCKELDAVNTFFGMFQIACKHNTKDAFVSAYKITDDFGDVICYVEMKRSSKQYTTILENTKKEKERMQNLASKDLLTGVLNRIGV